MSGPQPVWIPVSERLPEHGAEVLAWHGSVEVVKFYVRHTRWDGEDERDAAVTRELDWHGWSSREAAEDAVDMAWPSEPYFSWSGGDCDTKWLASHGFACPDDPGDYGYAPPITHWMPLPEPPKPSDAAEQAIAAHDAALSTLFG